MKNNYKLSLFVLLFALLGTQMVMGQASTNVAPSATTSAYTPDPNGIYQWYGINNGINSSCNSQEAFIWTSSYGKPNGTEYMQWEWSSAKTIGKITFINANATSRNMTGCKLQYWNGSTFVDWATLTIKQQCEDSVKFTPITSTRFRLTAFEMNGSGQQSNPNWREIMLWTASTKKDDIGITGIVKPLCSPVLKVSYFNLGTNNADSGRINWSVNDTMQPINYVKTSYKPGTGADYNLTPDFKFRDGATYKLKVWSSLPNGRKDSVLSNDTAKLTFKYLGPALTPTVKDVIKCGPGRAPISAIPGNAGDSIVWYDAATKGNIIARGKNTLTPPLFLGDNFFYAQGFKIGAPTVHTSGASGGTILSGNTGAYNGTMVDITPQEDMVLDSFAISFYQGTAGSTYEVWYKTGTYVGSERTSSAWTFLKSGSANVVNVAGRNRGYIKIPETALNKGTTYGFYITTTPTTGNDLFATYGNATTTNGEITVTGGTYIYGQWGSTGLYSPYNPDLMTFYRKASCPSSRAMVKVTVKPSPAGGAFIKGTPFTSPVTTSNGFKNNPDIVADGDQLTFEMTPPTGYNNAGHGTAWKASNLTFRTLSGRVLSSSYYTYTPPSSGGNGIITFTPDSKLTDTTLMFTMRLEDLGPHFCDSMLTRYIFVAPRPVPDFKFNQPVCDGDAVVFDNLSSISSGGIIYSWDFGTGNPADTSDAYTTVFTFPTYGTYDVKLKTRSLPYGYVVTKTIKVNVTEIPKIDFKVVNACEKVPVSFINNTTHSSTVVYAWDFGDPSSTLDKSGLKSPTWTYSKPGGYKVTLRATANGCTSELIKNANQFATPKANWSTPSLICDKTPVTLTNLSTIQSGNMGYTWFIDGVRTSNFANPSLEFSSATPKTVKMKVVSEFGCADSLTKQITPVESPKVDFKWDAACNLTNTNFQFTGTKPANPVITTFNWNFAGEGTTTVENPAKLFNNIGTKKVTLTLVSNNGCSNSITKDVNVKLQSKANFVSADVCEDDDAVFINKSTVSAGNLNYTWKFGDGNNSASSSPRHRYNIASISQTFNVTLVALVPGGCSDSITKAVTINANPDAGFTYTTSGRLVYFKAKQTGATLYQWRFGDGGSAVDANPKYNYIEYPDGKYTACLAVVNAAGCFSETCQTINISNSVRNINKLTGFKVFPNPNKGNFTVSIEEPKSDISIAVYNVLGDVIKTIETNPLKSVYTIDLNVANGVYLVKITNGGLVATQKVTVNK